MNKLDRRTFFFQAIAVGSALTSASTLAQPNQPVKLDENDPQAKALSYKHDTKAVDKQKHPKHDDAQRCDNCQLFQGKAGDEWAPCAIFAGKQVAGPGWCSAWIKKAA